MMGELSQVLPQGINKVKIGKWEIPMKKFTLNELAAIEEKFPQFESAWAALSNFGVNIAVTRFVLWLLIRRVDKNITEEEVGEAVDMDTLNTFIEQFSKFITTQSELEQKKEESEGETTQWQPS